MKTFNLEVSYLAITMVYTVRCSVSDSDRKNIIQETDSNSRITALGSELNLPPFSYLIPYT